MSIKIIHQIWFQGASEIPEKYHKNVQANKDLNPTWKHHIWAESDLRKACEMFSPETLKAFDSCEYLHQKVDLGRYVMLYHHGGMSIDMDARCLRSLDDFLSLFPPGTDVVVSEMSLPQWIRRFYGVRFNNAQIYCPQPHSQFLKLVIEESTRRIFELKESYTSSSQFQTIQYTTGPVLFHDVYRDNFEKGISIFRAPSVYLEPCAAIEDDCTFGPETFVYHELHQTWVDPNKKALVQIARSASRHKIMFALIFFILVSFALWKGISIYGRSLLWFIFGVLFHAILVLWNDDKKGSSIQKTNTKILRFSRRVNDVLRRVLTWVCISLIIFVFAKNTTYASDYLQLMALTLFVRGAWVFIENSSSRTDIQQCSKMSNDKILGNGCYDKALSLQVVSLLITLWFGYQILGRPSWGLGVGSFVAVVGSLIPIVTRQHDTKDIILTYVWAFVLIKYFSRSLRV